MKWARPARPHLRRHRWKGDVLDDDVRDQLLDLSGSSDWLFAAQREGHRSDDARNPVATSTNNVPLNTAAASLG